jgi:hypothetical protein
MGTTQRELQVLVGSQPVFGSKTWCGINVIGCLSKKLAKKSKKKRAGKRAREERARKRAREPYVHQTPSRT